MSHQDDRFSGEEEHWKAFEAQFERQNLTIMDTVKNHDSPKLNENSDYILPSISYVRSQKKHIQLSESPEISFGLHSSDERAFDHMEFDLGDLLAQGGMGCVFEARQLPLQRDVVIKMLRTDKQSKTMETRLLHEARLTGLLEHPNIVPVHQLGLDEEGLPMLVMKRIEGVTWSEILKKKRDTPEALPENRRNLEWHIRILTQVCRAMEFAHSKRIIHRDLKPSNIMIGEFGEVYVLDWGIALGLDSEVAGHVPIPTKANGLSGTPAYMAPEMLTVDETQLDERTDVYLLGAILYELMMGTPPHQADNVMALLGQICKERAFEFPPEYPAELTELCRCAMELYKEDRYQSVRDFRLALENYLTHRESYQLVHNATDLLHELEGHLSFVSPSDTSLPQNYVPPEDPNREITSLFWRCHFGFSQAIQVFPGNAEAQKGLQQLLTSMAKHELEQKDFKAAATLIKELRSPDEVLLQELRSLRDTQVQKMQDLEALKRIQFENSAEVSVELRRFLVITGGTLLTLTSLIVFALVRLGWYDLDHDGFMLNNCVALVFFVIVVYRNEEALLKNRYNWQLLILLVIATFVFIFMRLCYIQIDISIESGGMMDMVVLFSIFGAVAVFADLRILVGAVTYLLAALAIALWPKGYLLYMAIGHAITTLIVANVWNFDEQRIEKSNRVSR
mgnify:CR=1 FL=1